ncbi:MAG: hypothetical protein RIT38_363 [Bacteroidota bacterium]|jgi:hypothetical protein
MKYLILFILLQTTIKSFSQNKETRYLTLPTNPQLSSYYVSYKLHDYDWSKKDSIISILVSEKVHKQSMVLSIFMSKNYTNVSTDKIENSAILSVENFSDSLTKYNYPFNRKYNFKILYKERDRCYIHDAVIHGTASIER